MSSWRAYKQNKTGNTIIEVSSESGKILTVMLSPYKRRTMPQKEFQRLIERLQQAIELYDN